MTADSGARVARTPLTPHGDADGDPVRVRTTVEGSGPMRSGPGDGGHEESVASPAAAPRPAADRPPVVVYLAADAFTQARAVAGDGFPIEDAVAWAIQRGQMSRTPRPGEPSLGRDERLVRPFDVPWVAVVSVVRAAGDGGRRRRTRSTWRVVRLVPVGEGA